MASQTNSSLTTIFTLINSMVGGAMLTYPILFKQSGIIISLIILSISALISYKTCRIYVIHLSSLDKDVQDTIRRIMGRKWQKYFRLITGFYLVLLNIIYIVLICDQIYNIIYFILSNFDSQDSIADKDIDHLVFDKFSKQYLSLILFAPLLAMTFIKNLNFLIKLTSYGVYSVFIYFGFIIYEFSVAVYNGVDFGEIKWFSFQIGQLAGTSAVAFTIHTVVATVLKSNQKQQNNLRDLKISYLMGLIMYCAIGWIGSIAIWNKKCSQTIINCYLKDIVVLLVEISYLYGRVTVFPCFIEVGRARLLGQLYEKVQDKHYRNFNLIFMGLSTLCCFLGPYIKLDIFMSLVGSIVCFFFIYYIPTMLHFYCFYKNRRQQKVSLLSSQISQTQATTNQKCGHDSQQKEKYSQLTRKIGYGILNLTGIAVGIYGLIQVITKIFGDNNQSVKLAFIDF